MVRLSRESITQRDIEEYLSTTSDFAFELRTLKLLRTQGVKCQHGGLYEDPVTKKSRQFDIRAIARTGQYCVRLAIECKNVGENFPLLISSVPRHLDESFHEVAIVGEIEDGRSRFGMYDYRAHVVQIREPEGLYRANGQVGKGLAQVGREANTNANIIASDKEVFDKWGQSLASAEELVEDSYWEGSNDSPSISYVAVIPMVVVPDGRLWIAEHDSDGNCERNPHLTDQCSVFVNHEYRMGPERIPFRISHVEFVTFSRLSEFVTEHLNNHEGMDTIFPCDTLDTFVGDLRAGRVSF
jgi:hypothetical protein